MNNNEVKLVEFPMDITLGRLSEIEASEKYHLENPKTTLYNTEYVLDAYEDQYGIKHSAYVLQKKVEVMLKEFYLTKDYGEYYLGLISEDKDGNSYRYRNSAQGASWTGNNETWTPYLGHPGCELVIDKDGNLLYKNKSLLSEA